MIAQCSKRTTLRIGYSDILKRSAVLALGYDPKHPSQVYDIVDQIKDSKTRIQVHTADGLTHEIGGRSYIQRFGQEAHRELFGENFWVDQTNFSPAGAELVVLADCRFPNEAQAALDRGGEVWRIDRPGLEPPNNHISETPLPDHLITRTIPNNGSLENLKHKVAAALAEGYGR